MFSTLITTDELAPSRDSRTSSSATCGTISRSRTPGATPQYRAGHIPGAVFVHLDRDLSAPMTGTNGRHPLPSPEAAAAMFGRLGIARRQAGRRL